MSVQSVRRAEVARLLKAARWTCGDEQPTEAGNKVRELTIAQLVQRAPLAGWTANKIARIERMQRDTSAVELHALEQALGMPGLFDEVRNREAQIPEAPPDALIRSDEGSAPTT